jgi:hypothetical protein
VNDLVHRFERHHDAAADGVGATGESGAGAARDDGDAVLGAVGDERRHLDALTRSHDRVRGSLHLVVRVGGQQVGVGDHAPGGKDVFELRNITPMLAPYLRPADLSIMALSYMNQWSCTKEQFRPPASTDETEGVGFQAIAHEDFRRPWGLASPGRGHERGTVCDFGHN